MEKDKIISEGADAIAKDVSQLIRTLVKKVAVTMITETYDQATTAKGEQCAEVLDEAETTAMALGLWPETKIIQEAKDKISRRNKE